MLEGGDYMAEKYLTMQQIKKVELKNNAMKELCFDYAGGYVNVYEDRVKVFHAEYILSEREKKISLTDVYVWPEFRRKGYGTACLKELFKQLDDGRIIAITGKLGGNSVPQEFSTEEEYLQALVSFYTKAGCQVDSNKRNFWKNIAPDKGN